MANSDPPTKRRRKTRSNSTQDTNSRIQLSVTDFFRPTRSTAGPSTSRDIEEVVVIDSTDESSCEAIETYSNIVKDSNRESSPELFSSPAYTRSMTTAMDRKHPVSEPATADGPSLLAVSTHSSPPSRGCSRSRSTTPRSEAHSSHSSMSSETEPWSGVPLSELCFGPSAYPVLPPLQPSPTHTVLYRPRLKPGSPPQPFPDKFKDVWDNQHVRMPCSSKSMYPTESKGLVPRWDLIKEALRRPIVNSLDFEEALLTYNSHYSKRWSFVGLHSYFGEICSEEESSSFFGTLLPQIIDLALSLPNIVTHAVPLLKKQQNYSVTLSQQQLACLLANAFLCTFPRRNTKQRSTEYASYPTINFNSMFSPNARRTINQQRVSKLQCLFHYFARVTKKMPEGTVTFQRQVLNNPPEWDKSSVTFTKLHMTSEGTIEDQGHGMLQVDFANKYLGGGVLSGGCVQEEIRFLICPELIVSRLFTEELDNNECLVVTGSERFSNYRGYSSSFEWSGSHRDETTRDRWGRIQTKIVAIDALTFYSHGTQFKPGTIRRELNKAYCGFASNDYSSSCGRSMAVATGNWGCGVFGGDSRLKSLLQLMAAAVADRDVAYFTFGDCKLQKELSSLHSSLVKHGITVGQVWNALVNYQSHRSRPDKPSLYAYLRIALKMADKHTSPPRPSKEESPLVTPPRPGSPVTSTTKSTAGCSNSSGGTASYVDDSDWVVVTGNDTPSCTVEYSLH